MSKCVNADIKAVGIGTRSRMAQLHTIVAIAIV